MPVSDSIRRYRRFQGWDYSKGASLFITIATSPRRRLFGEIRGGEVELSPLGENVKESLESIPRLNPGISLYGHLVMPDHVHFNCSLAPGLHEPLKVLGGAVRRFKNYTTALAKRSLAINSGFPGMLPTVQGPGRPLKVCSLADGVAPAPRNGGRAVLGQFWQQGYRRLPAPSPRDDRCDRAIHRLQSAEMGADVRRRWGIARAGACILAAP